MSDIKVSVIVPMYNVERYLDQCVKSIQAQTLHDIEIILVDDGSPDRCGEMADHYATADPRIKVVHRENGGLGPARNSGMKEATGEYIGFVDSDDWIEPEMYERLYAAAARYNADVCFSGFKAIKNYQTIYIKSNPFAGRTLRGTDEIFTLRRSFYGALPEKLDDDPMPVSVWTNIYKRTLIESNDIKFKNIRSEDKFFNTRVCRQAEITVSIANTDYNYRRDGQSSIMASFSSSMIDSYLELFKELKNLAAEEPERFRAECDLRVKRCIIDYSRVACQVIANSASFTSDKKSALKSLIGASVARDALHGFPCHKLPIQQSIFAWLMRWHMTTVMLKLASIKGR